MRTAALAIFLSLLASPGVAAAPTPTAAVAVVVPAGPVTVPLGGEHTMSLSVTLTLAGLACTQDATVAIPVAISRKSSTLAGVMAHLKQTQLNFTIPAGAYSSDAPVGVGAYNKTMATDLTIMVATNAPADHEHTFVLRSTVRCQRIAKARARYPRRRPLRSTRSRPAAPRPR